MVAKKVLMDAYFRKMKAGNQSTILWYALESNNVKYTQLIVKM